MSLAVVLYVALCQPTCGPKEVAFKSNPGTPVQSQKDECEHARRNIMLYSAADGRTYTCEAPIGKKHRSPMVAGAKP